MGFPAPPLNMTLHGRLKVSWEHRFHETQIPPSHSVSLGQVTKPFFTLFSSLQSEDNSVDSEECP